MEPPRKSCNCTGCRSYGGGPRRFRRSDIAWLTGILLFCAVLAIVAWRSHAAPIPKPLGVWYQAHGDFAKWKARGVTVLIGYESEGGTVSCDQWCKEATAAGLTYFLQSTTPGLTQAHWNDPNCAGVIVSIDEPNQNNASKEPPAKVFAESMAIRAVTSKPIFINLDGAALEGDTDAEVWGYCQCADIIGTDKYPLNTGQGMGAWNVNVANTTARVKRFAGSKTVFIAVEDSDQALWKQGWIQAFPAVKAQMRGPTPGEYAKEVDDVRSWGCTPFVFPDVIGVGWESRDGTTPGIDGAMQAMAAQ